MAPLSGVRVADFTRIVAGPYCAMILADLGAEVLKIERPGSGDDARQFGPPFLPGGDSAYFMTFNRSKKSVVLDLATEEGRRDARDLVRTCDVVVENFRRGYMESVGLDHETLARDQPGLISCSISSYGETGPYRDHGGYDVMVSALGGMMSINGTPEQPPAKTGVAVLDAASGLYAVCGILSALRERDRTGLGQKVDVSLLGVQLAQLLNAATAWLLAGEVMERQGTAHPSIVPYQAFAAADGWVLVGGANDRLYQRVCGAVGRPDLAEDPRFRTNPDRVAHREELLAILSDLFLQQPVAEWVARLTDAGVPVAPVNRIDQVFEDPQVQHLGQVQEVEHPAAGLLRLVGSPLHLSRTPVEPPTPPPCLGQHTEEVLSDVHRRREADADRG
ncbi:MAG TPA: CoA transferase [Candidatus Binatia bacterium]|nr:CoA transferase [Candidatus Binatia bacterium]